MYCNLFLNICFIFKYFKFNFNNFRKKKKLLNRIDIKLCKFSKKLTKKERFKGPDHSLRLNFRKRGKIVRSNRVKKISSLSGF